MVKNNILICAHEISPYQGSECAEGWNIVLELSKYHNLFVLHASGSQFNASSYDIALKKYFTDNENINNIKFISVKQPFLTLVLAKINKRISPNNTAIGNPFLYFLGYRFWHYKAYRTAKKAKSLYNIELVHLLTSITFREPGYLWKLNLPYVWGPTGGLNMLPKTYMNEINWIDSIKEKIREVISNFQFNSSSRITKIMHNCNLVYTFSIYDKFRFENRGFSYVKTLTDAGCNEICSNCDFDTISSTSLNILWVGQLIKRKAFEILINSIYQMNKSDKDKIKIIVVGSGPLEIHYKEMVIKMGLNRNFTFIGQLKRDDLFNMMQKSDILVHTSYREATTNVIPESLSNCLPVICHDISGMSIAIDESCGYKIPLISPITSSIYLTEILISLIQSPDLIKVLKNGSKLRAKHLSWKNIANTIAVDYSNILKNNEGFVN